MIYSKDARVLLALDGFNLNSEHRDKKQIRCEWGADKTKCTANEELLVIISPRKESFSVTCKKHLQNHLDLG